MTGLCVPLAPPGSWSTTSKPALGPYAEATNCGQQPPRLKQPAAEFMKTLRAPRHLDPKVLEYFLLGVGQALSLSALFHWDRRGRPGVTVRVGSPMEAIGLSVQIDRNFSARQWVRCARCGNGFERKKGSDRFCSGRCRNYFNTTQRRRRIKLLKEGEEAWRAMPVSKRRKGNGLNWVAQWMGRKKGGATPVDPDWVERQLRRFSEGER